MGCRFNLTRCLLTAGWWNDHTKLALVSFGLFFTLSLAVLSTPLSGLIDADLASSSVPSFLLPFLLRHHSTLSIFCADSALFCGRLQMWWGLTDYESFITQVNQFLATAQLPTRVQPFAATANGLWLLRIWVSTLVGAMGGLYLLPAFRYAACYYHVTEFYEDSKPARAPAAPASASTPLWRSVLPSAEFCWRAGNAVNFFTPLVVALLWIKPLTRDAVVVAPGEDGGYCLFFFFFFSCFLCVHSFSHLQSESCGV